MPAAPFGRAARAADPLLGRRICDRFELTALIARGGVGKVYRAKQAPLGRPCAVKLLNASYIGALGGALAKRFWLEASYASTLSHPNIVTVFECGRTEDNIHYMAMEYLAGRSLDRAMKEAGSFSERRALRIAVQICRALGAAHAAGLVHCDLKPTNVFLVENGLEADFVKLLDFGLAKAICAEGTEEPTRASLLLGSPKYMAPEQIRADRVDARTDMYALGVVLFEMLTGKAPFDGPSSVNILAAHVNAAPPSMRAVTPGLSVSPRIEETVRRCLEKSPDRRFRSMVELLDALEQAGGGGKSTRRAYAAPEGERVGTCGSREASTHKARGTPVRTSGSDGLLRPAAVAATAMVGIATLVGLGARSPPGTPGAAPHLVAVARDEPATAAPAGAESGAVGALPERQDDAGEAPVRANLAAASSTRPRTTGPSSTGASRALLSGYKVDVPY